MEDSTIRPTAASDVKLPVEMVTLTKLTTNAGTPVVVRCESVSEILLADVVGALPGLRVPSTEDAVPDAEATIRRLSALGSSGLIEAGCFLDDGQGGLAPAFYFGKVSPHPSSIPGRLLHEADTILLVVTIMRLGGYLDGGPVDSGSFLGGERVGNVDGVGTLATGAGDRTDPVGSSA